MTRLNNLLKLYWPADNLIQLSSDALISASECILTVSKQGKGDVSSERISGSSVHPRIKASACSSDLRRLMIVIKS